MILESGWLIPASLLRLPNLKPPALGYFVGTISTRGGILSNVVLSRVICCTCQSWLPEPALLSDLCLSIVLTVIVAVPMVSSAIAPPIIAVFAFVHAIIFNAPLMRVDVEADAVAPLAS